MKVVTINGFHATDHGVSVHRADCKDVAKSVRGRDHFYEEFDTKRELWLDYNGDFLAEGSGAWEIYFYPCTSAMPDGGSYNTDTDEEAGK